LAESGDRLRAWLVTGTPGRVVATALELGAALAALVRRRRRVDHK
jgi:hypothetical protein